MLRSYNRQFSKAVAFGFLIGISGVILFIIPPVHKWEEDIGLTLLFKLRGPRQAPSDVLIVSIDKACSEELNLPLDPERWPRSIHGHLIDILKDRGASVIAFDIFFKEARSADDDYLFARAMRNAGNVVIVASISRENIVMHNDEGTETGDVQIEKLMSPLPAFSRFAAAVSPFPLPKVPVKISQYWTFKTTAGEMPTLPVTAFHTFALDIYDDFVRLMVKYAPSEVASISGQSDYDINLTEVIREVRDVFKNNADIADHMLYDLDHSGTSSFDGSRKDLLRTLVKMYQSPDSQYLNFYGAPRTIRTIAYNEILQLSDVSSDQGTGLDLRGKAVFVGLSASSQPEQKDGFYTVFTESSGLDISGVEIAATAFANLLEDMPVRPLAAYMQIITILIFGILAGMFCRVFSIAMFTLVTTGAGAIYLFAAIHQFKAIGAWYPLVIPLFFQIPLALLGGLACKYRESNRERQHIKEAFKYYLPENVVEDLSRNLASIKSGSQTVYGTCLYTDAAGYTGLSEMMEPGELSSLMNRYYDTVFTPVKKHDGIVSNVIGDAVLALWVTAQDEPTERKKPCLAALDLKKALRGAPGTDASLQTRIGLHSGHISLGHIGAADHYEYRPVGDIVNTATRIEGLNKLLGTDLLLSDEALQEVDGFLTRRLGKFLLAGKSQPVIVHELLCASDEANEDQRDICALFSEAYEDFIKQYWAEASRKFQGLIHKYGEDGPSNFYITQCEKFKNNPPGNGWVGVIRIDKK